MLFQAKGTALTGQQVQPVDIIRCVPMFFSTQCVEGLARNIGLGELYQQTLQPGVVVRQRQAGRLVDEVAELVQRPFLIEVFQGVQVPEGFDLCRWWPGRDRCGIEEVWLRDAFDKRFDLLDVIDTQQVALPVQPLGQQACAIVGDRPAVDQPLQQAPAQRFDNLK